MLSRAIAEQGIYPAVDPLDSFSRALQPDIVGEEHYDTATAVQEILQRYHELQDIIAILGMEELSDEDKLDRPARPQDPAVPLAAVLRRRGSSRAAPGKYVKLEDTVRGFKEIIEGKHDDLPEGAFYMVGTIEEAVERAQGDGGRGRRRARDRRGRAGRRGRLRGARRG